MVNGLWSAQLSAGGNKAGGVAFFVNGKVFGGDTAFIWSGTFQEAGDSFKATVHVKQYDRTVASLFGAAEYDIHIDAKIQGDRITGTGTSPSLGGTKLNVALTKQVNV
jgi:T3SS negative regulator,GrlR